MLPKDSVIISKQELLEIAKDYEEMANFHIEKSKEIEQAREEAIKEFMTKLENRLDSVDIILHEDSGEEYVSFNGVLDLMNKVAEEMGVE